MINAWKSAGAVLVLGVLVFAVVVLTILLHGDRDSASFSPKAVPCCKTPIVSSKAPVWTSKLIAISGTAEDITSDIEFSTDNTMTILNRNYPSTLVRILEGKELEDAARMFSINAPTGDSSALRALYKINIPANDKFLNGNTTCGAASTNWVIYLSDDADLDVWNVAFFSGDSEPNLESERNLCGAFRYQLPAQ